jgi:hypothetical protein
VSARLASSVERNTGGFSSSFRPCFATQPPCTISGPACCTRVSDVNTPADRGSRDLRENFGQRFRRDDQTSVGARGPRRASENHAERFGSDKTPSQPTANVRTELGPNMGGPIRVIESCNQNGDSGGTQCSSCSRSKRVRGWSTMGPPYRIGISAWLSLARAKCIDANSCYVRQGPRRPPWLFLLLPEQCVLWVGQRRHRVLAHLPRDRYAYTPRTRGIFVTLRERQFV